MNRFVRIARFVAPFFALFCTAPPFAVAAPFAYVPGNGGNTVSVIDIARNAVVATTTASGAPFGVAVRPGAPHAYTANFNSGLVDVIDTTANVVIANIPVNRAFGVALSPDMTRVYATSNAGAASTVSVIDTATNAIIATIPVGLDATGVAFRPDGTRAYVTNNSGSSVSVIDTAALVVIATIAVGAGPTGVAVTPDGSRVYVTNQSGNSVSVIDAATNTVVATPAVGSTPTAVAISPDGAKAYVTNLSTANISVIDTATNAVVATFAAGSTPWGIDFNLTGTRIYVANNNLTVSTLSVLDATTGALVATIPVGLGPIGFGMFVGGPLSDPLPTVGAIRPNSGSIAGGSAVVIEGTNLDTVTSVAFAGNAAAIVYATPTALTVTAPAHAAGAADLVVTNSGGPLTVPAGFTYVSDDDVARDFSVVANPSARWTYGSEPGAFGAFTPYASSVRVGSYDQWSTGGVQPLIIHNWTSATIAPGGANPLAPGGLLMHPGSAGQKSVVRWISPAAATYNIAGAFTGLDTAGTTTDVAVLQNNNAASPLFRANVFDTGIAHSFVLNVALAAGDTIEFAVGFGNGNFTSDSTGLDVVITATAPPPPPPSPVLGLAPASLTFPARTVGTTSPAQTVTLTNNGPGTLTLASITISGDFAFASSCPATLAQGATCTVAVTFTPVTAGARAGSLAIGSNAGASPQSVPLGGTGQSNAVGVLDVAPGSVTFDPQAIGSTSAPLLLTLTNSGTATVNRGPESVDGDYTLLMGAQADAATSSNTCGASIAPAASCALALVFTPTALGTRTGAIALPNDTATPVITVHLAGTGVNAPVPRVLGVRPAILAFGDQAVGAQSPARTVSLTNTSPATATITDLSSDSSEFIVSDTCTAIAPGVSCTALVTFRPNAIGTRLGELTVRTFTENDPYTVQLEGNGIFSATPQLEVSLTRIGFGNSLLGAWTYAGVTLTNVGLVPVVLGSISVLDDFIAAPECPATLDVGGACTLRVAFVPRRLGPHAASVAIFSNASNSPHHIDLTGTGCMIATSPHARVRPLLCGQ